MNEQRETRKPLVSRDAWVYVEGPLAMWADPRLTDRYSLPIPTAGAASRMLASINAKPECLIEPISVGVTKPLRWWTTQVQGRTGNNGGGEVTIMTETSLWDVGYVIRFRVVTNPYRDLRGESEAFKLQKFMYYFETGKQFVVPHLGRREYQATHWEFGYGQPDIELFPVTMDLHRIPFNATPEEDPKVESKADAWIRRRWDHLWYEAQITSGLHVYPEELTLQVRDPLLRFHARKPQRPAADAPAYAK